MKRITTATPAVQEPAHGPPCSPPAASSGTASSAASRIVDALGGDDACPTVDLPPRLLDRMREAIRLHHYSIRTEDAYVFWARRFVLFHGRRHPCRFGALEVVALLTRLAVARDAGGIPDRRCPPKVG